MTKITQQFEKIKINNRIGLMTHLVLGYPSFEENIETVELMEKNDVDFIELQLPFSDPVADGPTMMQANTDSLANGTTIKDCFKTAATITKKSNISVLFMTYLNIAFNYGLERFVSDSANIGIQGIILPDFPYEESSFYTFQCKKKKIDPIFVVSPNTSNERLKNIKKQASGFIYCTTRAGVTGIQPNLPKELKSYLDRIKKNLNLPRAVGFGIANKSHLKMLKNSAECAVIGSAIMNIVHKGKTKKERLKSIEKFLVSLQ